MNITVVGTGYVGLVTGACFAEFGNHVTCVDNDAGKIARLLRGEMPIYEPGLDALVERNVKAGRLEFTQDLAPAVARALVVFIAVGTPAGERRPRGPLLRARGRAPGRGTPRLVQGRRHEEHRSRGDGAAVRDIITEHRRGEHPFSVASNPEFLREGSAIEDFLRPNRVVLGVDDETAAAILKDLYRPLFLIETPLVVTSVVSAEVIKYASNAFLATKISFINEMADLCESLGADVHDVAKGMGLDQRIGRKFLHPGPGYGGSCFPKDTRAILELARDSGRSAAIIVLGHRRQRAPGARLPRQDPRGAVRRAVRQDGGAPRLDVQAEHRRPARVARDRDPRGPPRGGGRPCAPTTPSG